MANHQEQLPEVRERRQGLTELSERKRRLYEALADHNGDLAAMYKGAIQVLKQPYISDRFAMAAHNIRELVEKLPLYVDVPIEIDTEGLTRREQFLKWTDGVDPSSTPVPEQKMDRLSQKWSEVRNFFLKVCHHGRRTDLSEFEENLESLESLILPRLRPSTFKTQEVLDQIIEKAEAHD